MHGDLVSECAFAAAVLAGTLSVVSLHRPAFAVADLPGLPASVLKLANMVVPMAVITLWFTAKWSSLARGGCPVGSPRMHPRLQSRPDPVDPSRRFSRRTRVRRRGAGPGVCWGLATDFGEHMKLKHNVRSALLAGVIAFLIYVVIATITGQSLGAALGFGLALGVFTALVSFAIYTLITNAKNRDA